MNNLRLVLVDDNPEILEIVNQLLKQEFSIVGRYSDGNSVLQYGASVNPDIVVLDISLGDSSGFEVAKLLRQNGLSAHILFLTVHEDEQLVEASFEAGGSAYVVKRRLQSDLIPALHAVANDEVFVSNTAE